VKINHSLMDSHLESIPSLGTFTTRSFPSSDSQDFGGHTNGSLNFETLFFRSLDEVIADCKGTNYIFRLFQPDHIAITSATFRHSIKYTIHIPFSKDLTFLEVRVIRILWITASSAAGLEGSLLYGAACTRKALYLFINSHILASMSRPAWTLTF